MSIQILVNTRNPGQYFAACGVFELTARLDEEATACFGAGSFRVQSKLCLTDVLSHFCSSVVEDLEPDQPTSSPLMLGAPFHLRLDWWKSPSGTNLKVWAGKMEPGRILRAMLAAISDAALHTEAILDEGRIAFDPEDKKKKVEPYYFDARRGDNATSRDVGFSADTLSMTTIAFPAVEALCMVGLQRFRPCPLQRLMFEYRTWNHPIAISIAPAVACGAIRFPNSQGLRFENRPRSGYYKAFRPAVLTTEGE